MESDRFDGYTDDPEFKDWLMRVDLHAERALGLSIMDLPDALWRDWYDDGLSPRDALVAFGEEQDGLVQLALQEGGL